uniref:Uncharacterized protein n=1 Tax=Knipowitschia caucasica TaxID=637954 RepID=A0AAV2MTQ9_KNICA
MKMSQQMYRYEQSFLNYCHAHLTLLPEVGGASSAAGPDLPLPLPPPPRPQNPYEAPQHCPRTFSLQQ